MTRGIIIGKFMPPHLGHKYMVDFACNYADEVLVLVCTRPEEPILGRLRYDWMRKMCPKARVVQDTSDPPAYPEDHSDFWNIWKRLLQAHMNLTFGSSKVDFVFGSEDYCFKLAEMLGAKYIPVDKDRQLVPVSGTAIRNNPIANWEYIPEAVRSYYVKRVCVYGPESTGKTTLTKALALHFDTVYVEEYARPLLDYKNGVCEYGDIEVIARGHYASQQAMIANANGILFLDTDAVTTKVWSSVLFNKVPDVVNEVILKQEIDMYLLLDIDVPWVDDKQRIHGTPEQRKMFFNLLKLELHERKLPYVVISGDYTTRLVRSIEVVTALLNPIAK